MQYYIHYRLIEIISIWFSLQELNENRSIILTEACFPRKAFARHEGFLALVFVVSCSTKTLPASAMSSTICGLYPLFSTLVLIRMPFVHVPVTSLSVVLI